MRDYRAIIAGYKRLPHPPRVVLAIPPSLFVKEGPRGFVRTSGCYSGDCGRAVKPQCPVDRKICSGEGPATLLGGEKRDATTVFEGSSNCIFNCLIKEMIQQVASAEAVGSTNLLDLADILTTAEMDGVFGMHPNCDGHEALKTAIVAQAFQPANIQQDVAHAKKSHSFAHAQVLGVN